MLILSVETSTSMGSVALTENDFLIGEVNFLNKVYHSQLLLKMIDALLSEAAISLAKIDLFAVSVGPGSFTGLRVGVATMKGFATALGKPLTGVPTLEGFAGQLPYTPFPICPIIPAKKNEIYMALYHYDELLKLALLKPPKMIPLSRLWQEIKGPVHLLGDLPEIWKEHQMESQCYYSPQFRYPRAYSVAQIAYQTFEERGGFSEEVPGIILPEYPPRKTEPDGMLL